MDDMLLMIVCVALITLAAIATAKAETKIVHCPPMWVEIECPEFPNTLDCRTDNCREEFIRVWYAAMEANQCRDSREVLRWNHWKYCIEGK